MNDESDDDQPKPGPWDVLRTDRPPGLGDPKLRAQFLKKLPLPWEIRNRPSHLRMCASYVARAMAEKCPNECPFPDNIRLAKLAKELSSKKQRIGYADRPPNIDKRTFLIGGPWRKLFRELWPNAPFYKVPGRKRMAGPYFMFCQWMCLLHGFEPPKDANELHACRVAVDRLKKGSKPKKIRLSNH